MAEKINPAVWRLKAGLEKKFSGGHPWVFSSDLDQSPKGVDPGHFVELRTASNEFAAFGYGNPNTLIAFRVLSRVPIEKSAAHVMTFFEGVLERAAVLRARTGIDRLSHRLVFGEADGIPGVIIDRYLGRDERGTEGQVFVLQLSTAGSDHLLPFLLSALGRFPQRDIAFEGRGGVLPTSVVVARDSSARSMEGLAKEPRSVPIQWPDFTAKRFQIEVESVGGVARYWVNFIDGQKTGFFLDQRLNIRLAWKLFETALARAKKENRSLRCLDLFCYVGQWTVQIALAAKRVDASLEAEMMDASQVALDSAKENAVEAGVQSVSPRKCDVLQALGERPVSHYDIVICDPPAFVKKKKDLPTGLAAYQKLNREAIRRVRSGGVFVSCSCSGLVSEEDFEAMLARAVRQSGREVHWIARGGHGEDHPSLSEFPQGKYLKGWIGVVL